MATTALHLYGGPGKPRTFAPKAESLITDQADASFIGISHFPESHIQRHHFPPSGSHVGARHHHAFSLFFPGMRPAGA